MACSFQGSHTGQLQLKDRWQYDGRIRLALRSVKSTKVDFLNQNRYYTEVLNELKITLILEKMNEYIKLNTEYRVIYFNE